MLEKRVKLRLVFFLSRISAFHEKYKVKGVFWNVSKRCWCRRCRHWRRRRCRRRRRPRRCRCRRCSRRQNISFFCLQSRFQYKKKNWMTRDENWPTFDAPGLERQTHQMTQKVGTDVSSPITGTDDLRFESRLRLRWQTLKLWNVTWFTKSALIVFYYWRLYFHL